MERFNELIYTHPKVTLHRVRISDNRQTLLNQLLGRGATFLAMARKIRELIKDLTDAGFYGKWSEQFPFTLVVIMPTNRQLLEPTLDRTSSNARELLVRWGQLHAVRSVLSIVALVVLIASA